MSESIHLSSTRISVKRENLAVLAAALTAAFGDYECEGMLEGDGVEEEIRHFTLEFSEDVGDSFNQRVEKFVESLKDVVEGPFEVLSRCETMSDERDTFYYGGPEGTVDAFANQCVARRARDMLGSLTPLIEIDDGGQASTLTIGYELEDGDIAVLATLNNQDGRLSQAGFFALAKFVALSFESGSTKVQVLHREDAPGLVTPEGRISDVAEDAQIADFVHTDAQCKRLADVFLEKLREDVGDAKYQEICKRNAAQTDAGICHSHDFLDANMTMADAFEAVMGVEVDTQNRGHTKLWNEAWDLANNVMSNSPRALGAEDQDVDLWFKGSVVVNEMGGPLSVYSKELTDGGEALHFTDNPDDSVGGRLPAFLNIKNPLDLRSTESDHHGFWVTYEKLGKDLVKKIDSAPPSCGRVYWAVEQRMVDTPGFLAGVKRAGFDGLIFERSMYAGGPKFSNYKVIDSTQVLELVNLAPASIKAAQPLSGHGEPSP